MRSLRTVFSLDQCHLTARDHVSLLMLPVSPLAQPHVQQTTNPLKSRSYIHGCQARTWSAAMMDLHADERFSHLTSLELFFSFGFDGTESKNGDT